MPDNVKDDLIQYHSIYGGLSGFLEDMDLLHGWRKGEVMNGRDLILYILANKLEDEPVFKDGRFLGFYTAAEFAKKWDVGEETVRAWINLKYVDAIIIYDEVYIPANAKINIPN